MEDVKGSQAFVRLYADPENSGYVQVVQKPEDPNVRQSLRGLVSAPYGEGAR